MRFPVPVVRSLVLLAVLAAPLRAQLITPRTIPVSQAEQFDIHPSQYSGMGGASIAIQDTLLDAFVNPAKGARWNVSRAFSAPAIYSVSRSSGGGRTIPVGLMATAGDWFGSVAAALQEIDTEEPPVFFAPIPPPPQPGGVGAPGIGEQQNGNALAELMLGRRFGEGLSLAASLQWSRLHALDGTIALYQGSTGVDQRGGTGGARIGMLLEREGRSFEAVLVHHRVRLDNTVRYVDFVFDPPTQSVIPMARTVDDLEQSRTWGLHVAHTRALGGGPWTLGWAATANRISRSAVPDYAVMSLPADPGTITAFNVGMGVSRRHRGEMFGADFIYEPGTGRSASATRHTDYRFRNLLLRAGFSADLDRSEDGRRGANIQLGLNLRSVNYRLDERTLATGARTSQAESWTEWTPTWGLGFGFSSLEIRYRGQVMHGTGRPAAVPPPFSCEVCVAIDRGTPFTGSSGLPSSLEKVRVVMHHFTLSIPLR